MKLTIQSKTVLALTTLFTVFISNADTITVHNETVDKVLHVATYRKKRKTITRVGGPYSISPASKKGIARPGRKALWNRKLLFSTNKNALKGSLSVGAYKKIPRVAIGKVSGSKFYLAWNGKKYVGYNTIQWVIQKKIIDKIKELGKKIKEKVKMPDFFKNYAKLYKRIVEIANGTFKLTDSHSKSVATVRRGNAIAPKEAQFTGIRKSKARRVLGAELGKRYGKEYSSLKAHEVPTIGLCFTGGGYRAMFATIGYLQGLDAIKVLPASTYVAGLSGSTWALAPWITSNQASINRFAPGFVNKVTVASRGGSVKEALKKTFASNSKKDLLEFLKIVLAKKMYGQSVALVDYFGFTVGNPLLRGYQGKPFFQHTLSQLQRGVSRAQFPFPIFVCNERPVGGAIWFEFTPYEFGSQTYQAYIPSWSFGRKFEGGKSIDHDPEQPLSYILGICGSGFAYSLMSAMPEVMDALSDILPHFSKLKKIKVIQSILDKLKRLKGETAPGKALSRAQQVKFGAARIENPTYKLGGARYSTQKKLQLSDGGQVVFSLPSRDVIVHNFASVPLLDPQRNVDIIIMCDSDREGVKGKHLLASVMHAKRQKGRLKQFPKIDYEQLDKPEVSVFKDEKSLAKPVTIVATTVPDKGYSGGYNPANEDFTETLNFAWLPGEATRHSGLAKHIITKKESADAIWDAIKWWVDTKRGSKKKGEKKEKKTKAAKPIKKKGIIKKRTKKPLKKKKTAANPVKKKSIFKRKKK